MYTKTLEYVKTFAKFSTTDSASAVRESVPFFPPASPVDRSIAWLQDTPTRTELNAVRDSPDCQPVSSDVGGGEKRYSQVRALSYPEIR